MLIIFILSKIGLIYTDLSVEAIEKSFRSAFENAVNKCLVSSAENPAGNGGGSGKESVGSQYTKQANGRSEAKTNLWGHNN